MSLNKESLVDLVESLYNSQMGIRGLGFDMLTHGPFSSTTAIIRCSSQIIFMFELRYTGGRSQSVKRHNLTKQGPIGRHRRGQIQSER